MPYEKVRKNEPVCIADEVPFEIPESWEWVRLGSIGDWGSGATPSRSIPEYYGGDIPWLKTGDLNDGYIECIPENISRLALEKTSVRLNPTGSVLIAMYGATIGKVGILTFPATTNQACCACLPIEIYNEYLFYFLMSQKVSFVKRGEGGAQPNISKEKIIATLMPLPPLAEQYRIVAKIKGVLPFVEQYGEACSAANSLNAAFPDLLKKSILQEAVQGKLVPQDSSDEPASVLLERIRAEKQRLIAEGKIKKDKHESVIFRRDNSHYEKLDSVERCIDDELPFEIPGSWEWVRLGSVLEIARGGSPRPIQQYLTTDPDGINWIKIGDTDKGGKYIYKTKEKIRPEGVTKSRMVHSGDFLLTNSMSFGRPYILKTDGCIHDGWLVLSNRFDCYSVDFLYYILSSPFAYYQFCDSVSGAVVKNLNSDKVSNALFPLPPLNEQRRIVQRIEELFPLVKGL